MYIPLPNGMHHEWTMKAIEAGKHVLVEKPYSRRSAEVEEAWDAAARAGVVVMEAFMWRHHPQAAVARKLVEDGSIGRLRHIRTTFSFPLRDLSNIRMVADLDGGALMDVGCYCVSGARLLGGEPEHVYGEQVVGPTGVDVDFYGTLRFPGDVVAQFDASFTLPERQRMEAIGEDGTLVLEAPWRRGLGWPGAPRRGAGGRAGGRSLHTRARELRRRDRRRGGAVARARGRARAGARDRGALPLGRIRRSRRALSDARLTGLDVGTTGVKAIAISPAGEVLARVEREYPLSTPQPGWAEQDPEDWWQASRSALDELGWKDGDPLGFSGQMHGLVALGADDAVLRPAILWNDQRTGAECAEIEERVGLARLIELTGNRALAGFTAPKLLWLRRHEPDVYARIAHILLPKDYVRFRLTGERAIDAADASGTLLFDVARRRWSGELLELLELPAAWLPEAHECTTIGGAGDQAAGALGVGIDRPGRLSVVLGTSGVVFAALPAYAADPEARLHSFCHAVPDTWHAMGVMLSAAGSFRWLHDVLGAGYEELLAEAATWPPGVEDLLFAPYLAGERTPHPDPDARGAFTGLALRHDRGALARAVLEGVAFGLRDSLELLAELGVEPVAGRVSGGGARSELWLRIVASVLGLPLERTAVEEGAAFGAALLGGVAAGVFGSAEEAVAACVRVRDVVEPDPAWTEAYRDAYGRYRALYPALKSIP